jgi:hypothetical protein
LLVKARALAALSEQENGQIEFDYEPDSMPEYERLERPEYFQLWLDNGTALFRSGRLDRDLPRTPSLTIRRRRSIPGRRVPKRVSTPWSSWWPAAASGSTGSSHGCA